MKDKIKTSFLLGIIFFMVFSAGNQVICSEAENYITNPSFESDLSRWDIYDGTWIRDNTRAKHGNWSCKVEPINDGDESDPFYSLFSQRKYYPFFRR